MTQKVIQSKVDATSLRGVLTIRALKQVTFGLTVLDAEYKLESIKKQIEAVSRIPDSAKKEELMIKICRPLFGSDMRVVISPSQALEITARALNKSVYPITKAFAVAVEELGLEKATKVLGGSYLHANPEYVRAEYVLGEKVMNEFEKRLRILDETK